MEFSGVYGYQNLVICVVTADGPEEARRKIREKMVRLGTRGRAWLTVWEEDGQKVYSRSTHETFKIADQESE